MKFALNETSRDVKGVKSVAEHCGIHDDGIACCRVNETCYEW